MAVCAMLVTLATFFVKGLDAKKRAMPRVHALLPILLVLIRGAPAWALPASGASACNYFLRHRCGNANARLHLSCLCTKAQVT